MNPAELHTQIAKTLEQRFPETAETQPDVVAYHEDAVNYRDKAGGDLLRARP